MNLDWIKTEWQEQVADKALQKNCWNGFAPEFAAASAGSAEQSKAFRLVTEHQMVDASSEVLDLGCGAGRFSEAFARRCAHVTGIDLSDEMIRFAERRKAEQGIENLTYWVIDWHEADISALGWEKRFDLVFARNTPAVQSYRTFENMNRVSRGWCYLSKPIRWENSLLYKLVRALGLETSYRTFDSDMMYAYDILLQEGYFPMVDYEIDQFRYEDTLGNAYQHFRNRIGMKCALLPEQEDRLYQCLKETAENNIVRDRWNATIAILYWNTEKRGL